MNIATSTLAVALLLVSACGGGDDDDATPDTTAAAAAGTAPTVPSTPSSTLPSSTPPATTATVPAISPSTTAPAAPGPPSVGTVAPTTVAPPGPPTIEELLDSGRVLDLAHAGGDQDHPHSTMYAYRSAIAAGADVLEMDVQLTADGVLIVQHDATTGKTADQDLPVGATDLATLQTLDNAHWWSPQCWPCHDLPADAYPFRGVRTGAVAPPTGFTPDDFRIVTLTELAAAFPDRAFDIEIKGDAAAGAAVAEALATELGELGRLESSIVTSFDSGVVEAFHALAPDVATSPGLTELAAWLLDGTPLPEHHDVIQIPPFYEGLEVLSPATLALAEQAGMAVWVWPNDAATQENAEYYGELVAMGVDGIIAGRPAAARAAIDAAG